MENRQLVDAAVPISGVVFVRVGGVGLQLRADAHVRRAVDRQSVALRRGRLHAVSIQPQSVAVHDEGDVLPDADGQPRALADADDLARPVPDLHFEVAVVLVQTEVKLSAGAKIAGSVFRELDVPMLRDRRPPRAGVRLHPGADGQRRGRRRSVVGEDRVGVRPGTAQIQRPADPTRFEGWSGHRPGDHAGVRAVRSAVFQRGAVRRRGHAEQRLRLQSFDQLHVRRVEARRFVQAANEAVVVDVDALRNAGGAGDAGRLFGGEANPGHTGGGAFRVHFHDAVEHMDFTGPIRGDVDGELGSVIHEIDRGGLHGEPDAALRHDRGEATGFQIQSATGIDAEARGGGDRDPDALGQRQLHKAPGEPVSADSNRIPGQGGDRVAAAEQLRAAAAFDLTHGRAEGRGGDGTRRRRGAGDRFGRPAELLRDRPDQRAGQQQRRDESEGPPTFDAAHDRDRADRVRIGGRRFKGRPLQRAVLPGEHGVQLAVLRIDVSQVRRALQQGRDSTHAGVVRGAVELRFQQVDEFPLEPAQIVAARVERGRVGGAGRFVAGGGTTVVGHESPSIAGPAFTHRMREERARNSNCFNALTVRSASSAICSSERSVP
ncbi:hypothetical protein LzC2_42210 [Planctomycetes bacterium LzC2]|uniref:Uncharacterized protein n=1 Tax=Alienimonas chondri TaxID=2681879 RepID=A0ABX1VJZ3_9PLAN|nr:hypothetical protein [Alienimonas chondri]